MVEIALFERGVGHFERKFHGERVVPTNNFWHQKTRVPGLSHDKKIAENCNQLSRVHQRYRQTERQTTDGRAMAYSERERKFTSPKNHSRTWVSGVHVEQKTSSKLLHMQSGPIKRGQRFKCANVVNSVLATLAQTACVGSTTDVLRIPDVRMVILPAEAVWVVWATGGKCETRKCGKYRI